MNAPPSSTTPLPFEFLRLLPLSATQFPNGQNLYTMSPVPQTSSSYMTLSSERHPSSHSCCWAADASTEPSHTVRVSHHLHVLPTRCPPQTVSRNLAGFQPMTRRHSNEKESAEPVLTTTGLHVGKELSAPT
ncbi:unnamed protein product [Chondrus crispus]|uniref:Uncharacterized protein n=1 Tax=Chondrus crispus TaxID=2769 RepID=R7QQC4_CHOCR|nr:unnamed protein product [Chondrus crispus]CDF39953.1 unnamed protein product [Chondrus crispus]|eukprot:XP_005710247.1 unnamed protein product [Chondrus crispus]